MRRLILLTLMASALALSNAARAQTPAPAPAPDASAPDAAAPAAPAKKKPAANPGDALRRQACKDKVDQSLKGADLADAMAVCIAQARVDCLKKAVDDKVRGKKREAFMRTCNGA